MDLDRIDWTVYKKEDTKRILSNSHFYFCLVFAIAMILFLVSCSTSPSKKTEEPARRRDYEPGYLRR